MMKINKNYLKYNAGEWSELLVLLKIIAEKKLTPAYSNLRKMEQFNYPVFCVYREEIRDKNNKKCFYRFLVNYQIKSNHCTISIKKQKIFELKNKYNNRSNYLKWSIKTRKQNNRSIIPKLILFKKINGTKITQIKNNHVSSNKKTKIFVLTNKINLAKFSIPNIAFYIKGDKLLSSIKKKSKKTKGSFEIPWIWGFRKRINAINFKSNSTNKKDIEIKLHDTHTNIDSIMSFSVKSYLGNKPTLFNASKSTNFIYKISRNNKPIKLTEQKQINKTNTNQKLKIG